MAANWIGRAKNGEAPFTAPIDLRMVAPMNAGPLYFIARPDSSLRTVAGLRGKRVAVGLSSSGMAQHARVMFGVFGLTDDIEPHYLDFAAGAEAVLSGAVDAQLQCPIPNKVMTELCARTPIKVLPYADGTLDALLAAVPYYRRTVMRKGALRGLDADVDQPAVVNVLVTHARTSEATARTLTATVIAAAEELGGLNPLFAGLDALIRDLASGGRAQFEFGGVALHPGALAAYRDAGLLA